MQIVLFGPNVLGHTTSPAPKADARDDEDLLDAFEMIANETTTFTLPAHVYPLFISPRLPLKLPAALPVIIFPNLFLTSKGVIAAPFLHSSDSLSALSFAIMVNSPVTIFKGDIVANLILLRNASEPFDSISVSEALAVERPVCKVRPTMEFNLNGRSFSGILDTGADISVIRESDWPPQWPLESAPSVKGVGGEQPAKISVNWIAVTSSSSEVIAFIKPVTLPIHVNLWGRDLLSQFRATISLQ